MEEFLQFFRMAGIERLVELSKISELNILEQKLLLLKASIRSLTFSLTTTRPPMPPRRKTLKDFLRLKSAEERKKTEQDEKRMQEWIAGIHRVKLLEEEKNALKELIKTKKQQLRGDYDDQA